MDSRRSFYQTLRISEPVVFLQQKEYSNSKNPSHVLRKERNWGFAALSELKENESLAMTYSRMGKPHTTIGDASFHC